MKIKHADSVGSQYPFDLFRAG